MQDLDEKVALCEEFQNDAAGKVKCGGNLFDRRVSRIITRGTLIDENFVDPYENNFLLSVFLDDVVTGEMNNNEHTERTAANLVSQSNWWEQPIGLAWLDLSTGDFFTQRSTISSLVGEAARISAREIVLPDRETPMYALLRDMLQQQELGITHHHVDVSKASVDNWSELFEGDLSKQERDAFTIEELYAGELLLSYVRDRMQGNSIRLLPPVRRLERETMSIDTNSMKALEILNTARGGASKGSLLHTIRRTVTPSGTRLLRSWLTSPSMSLHTINERLDLVAQLLKNLKLRAEIVRLLKLTHDSLRLVQKFSIGRGDADDLVSLALTVETTTSVASLLRASTRHDGIDHFDEEYDAGQNALVRLSNKLALEGPVALADLIRKSIDEDSLLESRRIDEAHSAQALTEAQDMLEEQNPDGLAAALLVKTKPKRREVIEVDSEDQKPWILRKTASLDLQTLHEQLAGLDARKITLTQHLRDFLAAPTLSLRWTPGLGHVCHVKDKDVQRASSRGAQVLKKVKTTSWLHHPSWRDLGLEIDQMKLRIRGEERKILQSLRKEVISNLVNMRHNAAILDELDVTCSFATLAEEHSLVRPALNEGCDHHIVGGRHPTVKQGLEQEGRAFVSNDCHVGEKERVWLITGPNMAGKSTFLRQNALISVLAQCGSFVPAESAEIGLVDQIFTRVGSADNLFKDQSTFMLEMIETATILKQATPSSFVIMDEIGRGTTPEDGVAIGFACLHHLYHKNRCRTLFATHFHALADMTNDFKHLACYCTTISEGEAGSFAFVHRLQRGVNRTSHALRVAALAGVPTAAIDVARAVLQKVGYDKSTQTTTASIPAESAAV